MEKVDKRKQLAVRLDSDVYRDFTIALAINGQKTQDMLLECIKAYIQSTMTEYERKKQIKANTLE